MVGPAAVWQVVAMAQVLASFDSVSFVYVGTFDGRCLHVRVRLVGRWARGAPQVTGVVAVSPIVSPMMPPMASAGAVAGGDASGSRGCTLLYSASTG